MILPLWSTVQPQNPRSLSPNAWMILVRMIPPVGNSCLESRHLPFCICSAMPNETAIKGWSEWTNIQMQLQLFFLRRNHKACGSFRTPYGFAWFRVLPPHTPQQPYRITFPHFSESSGQSCAFYPAGMLQKHNTSTIGISKRALSLLFSFHAKCFEHSILGAAVKNQIETADQVGRNCPQFCRGGHGQQHLFGSAVQANL